MAIKFVTLDPHENNNMAHYIVEHPLVESGDVLLCGKKITTPYNKSKIRPLRIPVCLDCVEAFKVSDDPEAKKLRAWSTA